LGTDAADEPPPDDPPPPDAPPPPDDPPPDDPPEPELEPDDPLLPPLDPLPPLEPLSGFLLSLDAVLLLSLAAGLSAALLEPPSGLGDA
jgi:hypothetical protein